MKRYLLVLTLCLGIVLPNFQTASADVLTVSQDRLTGYNRSLFKLWIDADKDGCDTRAEVLIEEAVIKPKIGKKCALTGGKWLSAYDGKTTTKTSDLDIDHVVPLAEAWRSGAWAWSATKRQAFANDLEESKALIAVSLGLNRSKGDKDVSAWLPPKGVCTYVENWITVKIKWALTADSKERNVLNSYIKSCGLVEFEPAPAPTPTPTQTLPDIPMLMTPIISVENSQNSGGWVEIYVPGYFEGKGNSAPIKGMLTKVNQDDRGGQFLVERCRLVSKVGNQWVSGLDIPVTPMVIYCNILNDIEFEFYTYAFVGDLKITSTPVRIRVGNPVNIILTPTPTPSAVDAPSVNPGAFCSPAGATGKAANGVTYTCKTSPTDIRNRWRQ